jgi:protein tyrosine/serine phosphatase
LKYKIKKIISLAGDQKSRDENIAERQAAKELGIERVIFTLPGNGAGDVNDYAHIIAEICQAQKEKKPVLVHCVAGAQRTGGIIAAYRLLIQHKDATSVRAEMTHYGFDSDSNTNLRAFLNSNMMKIAEELKKMGVIDRIPSSIPEIRR